MPDLKNILIKDLFDSFEISVRSYHVCSKQGLNNIDDLMSYLKNNGDFLNLKSSGRKTDKELKMLCERFATDGELEDVLRAKQPDILDMYLSLNQYQRHLVEKNYLFLETKLSARTRNIINHISDGQVLESVLTALGKINYKYLNLKNAGVRTFDELENLVADLTDIIKNIDSPEFFEENEKDIFLNNLTKTLKKTDHLFDQFLEEQYQFLELGSFPFIKFLNLALEHSDLIKQRDKNLALLFKGYDINISTQKIGSIAASLQLSVERVRQLTSEEKIDQYFWGPIKSVLDILKTKSSHLKISGITIGNPLLLIDETYINNENESSFSQEFLAKAVSILANDYEVLNIASIFFLIAKDILITLDIRKMIYDLTKLISSKRKESYVGHVENLIANNIKQDQQLEGQHLDILVKDILTKIFKIDVSKDGEFIINRNSKRTIAEHIADVLNSANEPLNVNSISKILQSRGVPIKSDSVRSYILRNDKFILVGPSTYALKDWESIMLLQAGTIKDLIEKYLAENVDPKHILDISRYVTQFRDTNIYSIFRNIQSDPHNKFRYFGQMFFGLNNKQYANYQFRAINRHWFEYVAELLSKQGFLDLPTLIKDVSRKYKVSEVHVEYLLLQKAEQGRLIIGNDKIVTPNDK